MDIDTCTDMAALVFTSSPSMGSSNQDRSPRSPSPPSTPPDGHHHHLHSEPGRNNISDNLPGKKKITQSIFIEHLEDALPTHEEMERFDCFSPGAYIESRRHSLDLAGLGMGMMGPFAGGDEAGAGAGAGGEAFYAHAQRRGSALISPLYTSHGHQYTDAAHLQQLSPSPYSPVVSPISPAPFAALVRRLSYSSSSSRHRASRHAFQGGKSRDGRSGGRPKTSSGPLMSPPTSASPLQTSYSAAPPSRLGSPATHSPTAATNWQCGSGSSERGSKNKSRDNLKRSKRPSDDLARSKSFADEVLLRTSMNGRPGLEAQIPRRPSPTGLPASSSGILTLRNVSENPPKTAAASAGGPPLRSADEEAAIRESLANFTLKRMSMPNLPAAPPVGAIHPTGSPASATTPGLPFSSLNSDARIEGRRSSSPVHVLGTPSAEVHALNRSTSSTSTNKQEARGRTRKDSFEGRRPSLGGGWPWNRRASSSSISLSQSLSSPRPGSSSGAPLGSPSPGLERAGRGGGFSPTPSFLVLNKSTPPSSSSSSEPQSLHPADSPTQYLQTGRLEVNHASAARVSRTPSPNLPLRTSPLFQPPTPEIHDTGPSNTTTTTTPGQSSRPGNPRRSLSASFALLGKKVAGFGNSAGIAAALSSSSSSTSASSGAAAITGSTSGTGSPAAARQTGQQKLHAPLAMNMQGSPHEEEEEVPWTFRVHGVYPASTGVPKVTSTPPISRPPRLSDTTASHYISTSPVPSTEAPQTSLALSLATSRPSSPLAALPPVTGEVDLERRVSVEMVREANDDNAFLSPTSALNPPLKPEAEPLSPSRSSEGRPRLYRSSKSDDASRASPEARKIRAANDSLTGSAASLSTSPPASPGSLFLGYASHKSPTPVRQPSPSPSRNLTKIPEAEEQDGSLVKARKEEWLASLRGRPVVGKRRMSAADIFGQPTATPGLAEGPTVLQKDEEDPAGITHATSAGAEAEIEQIEHADRSDELDFSKRPVISPTMPSSDSPTQPLAIAQSGTPTHDSARPRAVSQSSLLSASRPNTPGLSSRSSSKSGLRVFPVITPASDSSLPSEPLSLGTAHRHTHSMPVVSPQDLAALEVTGAGAPESSVLAASHARFAKALSATSTPTVVSPPLPVKPAAPMMTPRKGFSVADKEAMKKQMLESDAFESAIADDEEATEEAPDLTAITEAMAHDDQGSSSALRRTPKLSYATSASEESDPSASAPSRAGHGRMYDPTTPSKMSTNLAPSSLHTSSMHTASSMSNANAPKSAFDILLSKQGIDRIDGLPTSRVASWARRDASDDSKITISTVGSSGDDDSNQDPFDGTRISVW